MAIDMSTNWGEQVGQRRWQKQDQERQAELGIAANAGLSPEAQREYLLSLYKKDPSAFKQHIENLFRRLTGKSPQSTPDAYPAQSATVGEAPLQVGDATLPAPPSTTVSQPGARTQKERQAQILSGGTTPRQRKLEEIQAQASARGQLAPYKVYISPDGKERQAFRVGDQPEDWQIAPTSSGTTDEKKRQDYKAAVDAGYKGSFEQWTAEEGAKGRAAGTPTKFGSPGAQYMHALVKQNSKQPLTPEEESALKSYPEYVRQTSVIPGVARAAAFGANRPIVVVNPSNPQQTMIATAAQAERGQYATPQSIAYQVDSAGQKAMIPRNLGQNLAALSTAEDHLNMLGGMVDALGNGDYPLLNSLGLRWAQATGDPAPTNFDTLKTSLEGEMARAYTGVGATNQETAMIGETISRANSPQQLRGALQTAHEAMAFRKKNLWGQVNQAKNVPLVPSKGAAPASKSAAPAPKAAAGKGKPWYKQSWAKAHPGEDANAAADAARAAGREVVE